jgi:hypothetical protein
MSVCLLPLLFGRVSYAQWLSFGQVFLAGPRRRRPSPQLERWGPWLRSGRPEPGHRESCKRRAVGRLCRSLNWGT